MLRLERGQLGKVGPQRDGGARHESACQLKPPRRLTYTFCEVIKRCAADRSSSKRTVHSDFALVPLASAHDSYRTGMASTSLANWHWRTKGVEGWSKEWFVQQLTGVAVDGVSVASVTDVEGDAECGMRKSKCVSPRLGFRSRPQACNHL